MSKICLDCSLPCTDKHCVDATPFWHQLKIVVTRNNKMLWRSPDYVWSRLFVHAFISLFVSLPFLQLGHDSRDLQYRVFGIFWVTILPAIVMGQLEPMWIINRRIFVREASSRIYSPYVFAIGQLVGEMPYSLLCGVVYWVLMVYPMGFGKGSSGVGGTFFQLLPVLFTELFGVTLGQLIGAISPSMQVCRMATTRVIYQLITSADRSVVQSICHCRSWYFLRCSNSLPDYGELLALLALPTRSVHPAAQLNALGRAARPQHPVCYGRVHRLQPAVWADLL